MIAMGLQTVHRRSSADLESKRNSIQELHIWLPSWVTHAKSSLIHADTCMQTCRADSISAYSALTSAQ